MKLIDFLLVFDEDMPIWVHIEDDNDATYYENPKLVESGCFGMGVDYITKDGEGVVTVGVYRTGGM